ncbi:hypothetical protein [Novosphingobium sp. KACC 22771]|uniref:hypothetical protein n=1 Tax=Novosphingobium sp. KACC 22771 TaxID=3025670 RepID=UPI002365E41F|nr:hypothetical protein [Novosphingobium sp. KACC 22771]WDF74386.1 hypothetical protein PQ467_20765 [Novosphingobium sp. KACC 22771]
MTVRYQPLGKERFTVEHTFEGEQIRIKAKRQIFPMLFLPVWLVGWTAGGIAAISQLIQHFEPFLVFWLCGWAVGWLFASGTLIWMFTGTETIRVIHGDLEIAHHALGFRRAWLYQGRMIRALGVAPQPAWPFKFQWQVPFFSNTRAGAIRFDYGARTFYCAAGLDDAEARQIVEILARTLPTTTMLER